MRATTLSLLVLLVGHFPTVESLAECPCAGNPCIPEGPCCVNGPDDGDPCTYDCACAGWNCQDPGGDFHPPKNCDDGNECTEDSCVDGECINAPTVNCDDGDPCTTDTCDPAGGCINTPPPDPCECNPCAEGCPPPPPPCSCDAPCSEKCPPCACDSACDDDDVCTIDSCDPDTGCSHTTKSCDDDNPCTDDSCDPATGCVHTPKNCDDGDPCTDDSCRVADGQCKHKDKDCGDDDACTDDSCSGGNCQHTGVSCDDDGNPCTNEVCDAEEGCTHPPKCGDNDACTNDICDGGTCSTTPVNCDDGDDCTVDSCDPEVGCIHEEGCGGENCGFGSSSPELNSIDVSFHLGGSLRGTVVGYVILKAKSIKENTYTPSKLVLATKFSGDVERIPASGTLRQVRVPSGLVDILPVNNFQYTISFYANGQFGPKNPVYYTITGQPFMQYVIAHPDVLVNPNVTPTELDELVVQKFADGSLVSEHHYVWQEGIRVWRLNQLDDQSVTLRSQAIYAPNMVNNERVETYGILEPDGSTAYIENRTFHLFPWGEELVKTVVDPAGAQLTTEIAFYEDAGQPGKYTRKKSVQNADGSWVVYDYDAQGRKVLEIHSWLDVPMTYDPAQAKAIYYDYTPLTSYGDSADPADARKPRTIVETVLDKRISQTYWIFVRSGGQRTEIQVQCPDPDPTIPLDDAQNLRTETTYDSDDRTLEIVFPDGRRDEYEYEAGTWSDNGADPPGVGFQQPGPGPDLRTSIKHYGDDNTLVAFKSTKDRTVTTASGQTVYQEVHVWDGSVWQPVTWTVQRYDPQGRLTQVLRSDGTRLDSTWSCCNVSYEKDEDGIETTYEHDALGRVITKTKVGVPGSNNPDDTVTAYEYNAMGKVRQETTSAGGLTLWASTEYDVAGRVKTVIDQRQLTAMTVYGTAPSGHRTVTLTSPYPGGPTQIMTYYHDGQVKSSTGTALVASYYSHDVVATGATTGQLRQQTLKGSDNPATTAFNTQTLQDGLGRTIETRERYDTQGSLDVIRRNVYNDAGRLIRVTTGADGHTGPLLADQVYAYDQLGRVVLSGLDLSGNGAVDLDLNDRITGTETSCDHDGADWWLQTITTVYSVDNDETGTPLTAERRRLSGFASGVTEETVSEDLINGNQMGTTVVRNRTAKTVTRTVDHPDSTTNEMQVTINGLLQSSQSKTGVTTTFEYDALSRRTRVIDPRTGPTTTAYTTGTPVGLVDYVDDPENRRTDYEYDSATGQLKWIANPDGKRQYFAYSTRGELLRTWGETTYPVEYGYDDLGRRTSITTYRTDYAWTGATWPENPSGDTTLFIYGTAQNPSRFLTRKQYADGNGTVYAYTPDGRVATRTWARQHNGQPLVTSYDYFDDAGEPLSGDLQSVTYSDGTTAVTYTYNRLGRQQTITDVVGTRTFTYRDDGQLDTEDIAAGGSGLYSKLITRKYQDGSGGSMAGRRSGFKIGTESTPNADYEITYGYDVKGRLESISGTALDTNIAYYTRLANSDLVQTLQLNAISPAVKTTRTYDPKRDLVSEVLNEIPPDDKVVSRYQYGLDALGRRKSAVMTGEAFVGQGGDHHWRWGYNERSELTSADRCSGTTTTGSCSPMTPDTYTYAYDPIGNREQAAKNGSTTYYCANELNQYQYEGAAQITCPPQTPTPIYDADGNLTRDNQFDYAWDAENRLKQVVTRIDLGLNTTGYDVGDKKIDFTYDYMHRRVRKTVSTYAAAGWVEDVTGDQFFVYDQWNVVLVLDANNANAVQRKYTWGLDLSGWAGNSTTQGIQGAGGVSGLLAVQGAAGPIYWFFHDANGNVSQAVLILSLSVAAHYEYDAYGNAIVASGTYAAANPFRFSTKWFDAETGLGNWTRRYYDPSLGRWLNRDPIEEQGGLNLYAYTRNSPTFRFDPLGEKCCLWIDYDKTIDDPGSKPAPWPRPNPTDLCSKNCGSSTCPITKPSHCTARILSANPLAPQPSLGLWGKDAQCPAGCSKASTSRVCKDVLESTIWSMPIFPWDPDSQRDSKLLVMAHHAECDQHVNLDDNESFSPGTLTYPVTDILGTQYWVTVTTYRPPQWVAAISSCCGCPN